MRAKPGRALAFAMSVLACASVLAGCSSLARSGGDAPWRGIIELGLIAPFAGPTTANGESLLAGARAAVDAVNRAGGVNGYRVLVVASDEGNASSPADLVADPDVLAVVGGFEPGRPDLPERFGRAGLIWMSTEPIAEGPGHFPLVAAPEQGDRAVAAELEKNWGLGAAEAADALARCQAGRVDGARVDLSDGELLCGLRPDGIAAALLAAPSGQRILCVDGCDAPEIARWAGPTRLEVIDPGPRIGADGSSRLATLGVAAPVPRYAALGYDAGELFIAAARAALAGGSLNRAGVARAMTRSRYHGLTGDFDPSGAIGRDAVIRSVS